MVELPGFLEIAAAFLIVWVGATIQAVIGMGLNLFAIPLLLTVNAAFVPGPVLLASLCLTVLAFYRMPSAIDYGELKFSLSGLLIGTIVAAIFLSNVSASTFENVLGAIILFSVIIIAAGRSIPITRTNLLGAGVGAGVLGTIAGAHAPPIALLYQSRQSCQIRGAILIFVGAGNLFSVIALYFVGRFNKEQLILTFLILPGVLAGVYTAPYLSKTLSDGAIRTMVLVISGFSGLMLVIK